MGLGFRASARSPWSFVSLPGIRERTSDLRGRTSRGEEIGVRVEPIHPELLARVADLPFAARTALGSREFPPWGSRTLFVQRSTRAFERSRAMGDKGGQKDKAKAQTPQAGKGQDTKKVKT